MILKKPFIIGALGAVALAGCVNNQPFGPTTEDNRRTQTGMATGALIGAAIGTTRNRGSTLGNAAAGAAVGALIGGAIGASLDAQAAELRRTIGNDRVSITNTGSELIVNLPQDILFAVDSASLRPDLTADLSAVARSLLNYPDTTVQVVGHTDNTGSAAYNRDLSLRRANSVAGILRSNGVPGGRIQTFGQGFDRPVASNATEAGRAQNRRVEIIIRPN
jgi:outer membrane protein OmpA-like peptidoglycan-associated protein